MHAENTHVFAANNLHKRTQGKYVHACTLHQK